MRGRMFTGLKGGVMKSSSPASSNLNISLGGQSSTAIINGISGLASLIAWTAAIGVIPAYEPSDKKIRLASHCVTVLERSTGLNPPAACFTLNSKQGSVDDSRTLWRSLESKAPPLNMRILSLCIANVEVY
jgi:hypothetical protein